MKTTLAKRVKVIAVALAGSLGLTCAVGAQSASPPPGKAQPTAIKGWEEKTIALTKQCVKNQRAGTCAVDRDATDSRCAHSTIVKIATKCADVAMKGSWWKCRSTGACNSAVSKCVMKVAASDCAYGREHATPLCKFSVIAKLAQGCFDKARKTVWKLAPTEITKSKRRMGRGSADVDRPAEVVRERGGSVGGTPGW